MSRRVSDEQTPATSTASLEDVTRADLADLLGSSPTLLAALNAERAAFEQRIDAPEQERDNLRASHERLRQELELFKRRLFIAKAERADTEQLKNEFGEKLRKLDELAGTLGIAKQEPDEQCDAGNAADDKAEAAKGKAADGKPQEQRRHWSAQPSRSAAQRGAHRNFGPASGETRRRGQDRASRL